MAQDRAKKTKKLLQDLRENGMPEFKFPGVTEDDWDEEEERRKLDQAGKRKKKKKGRGKRDTDFEKAVSPIDVSGAN